jgi:hypothetical protein
MTLRQVSAKAAGTAPVSLRKPFIDAIDVLAP